MARKVRQPSQREQELVADILCRLTFCNTLDDVWKVYKDLEETFNIQKDPFTGCPVTAKEYLENVDKYNRQSREHFYL